MTVGVLALQGSFNEHLAALKRIGVKGLQIRKPEQLEHVNALIIPGGESTTMAKLAEYHNLFPALRNFIKTGKPVWGTCAGLIFLADKAVGQKLGGQELVGGLDCTVHRNFFGSQIQSFEADILVPELAATEGGPASFRGVFIRAPAILETGPDVQVLAEYAVPPGKSVTSGSDVESQAEKTGHEEKVIVAVKQGNLLATAFHPELTTDTRWHSFFLKMVGGDQSFYCAKTTFRPDSVLGEGGFGSVYKGWIDEHTFVATKPGTGIVIAVKRLNQEGYQGHKEWLAEVNYLGQLDHPNLVKLIGYCLEDEQRLLVYEFMPRGSLENHLFRKGSFSLSWKLRMKVALGAAKGLAFLHSDQVRVIYRDFKTSNVLLDSNYNAKLSDFGLAKDGPTGDKSHVSTRVMGTYGYAAPEYLATGHLTAKSDIYSFGVVLLEMLSGRRAIDKNRPPGEHILVDWARPYLSNKRRILHVLDTRIEGQYSLGEAFKAATIALQCLSTEAKFRPTMGEVVLALEDLQNNRGNDPNTKIQDISNKDHNSGKVGTEKTNNAKASYPRPSASLLFS